MKIQIPYDPLVVIVDGRLFVEEDELLSRLNDLDKLLEIKDIRKVILELKKQSGNS